MSKTKIIIEEDVSVGGAELHVPFPLAEYKNRLNKIRKSMQEAEIDLLYVTEPENLFYISGYNVTWFRGNSSTTWNDSTVAGIAIHVDHDKFIQFDLPDEEGVLQHSSICTDQRIYYDIPGGEMYGKEYESASDDVDLIDLYVRDLKAEGWLGGRASST